MVRRRALVTTGGVTRSVDLTRRLPVNPNASAEARNLLHQFYRYRGIYTLSGQEQGDDGGDQDALLTAHNGGVRPAIRGYDALVGGLTAGNATTFLSWMVDDWHTDRVIPTISNHWTPAVSYETNAGSNEVRDNPVTIANLFINGTTENTRYNTWKQNIGDDLQVLRDADVPVLFRPFHETGGGWFWWSKGTSAEYRQLYRDTFDYMINVRGLNNVLWVWNGGIQALSTVWYPGPKYADFVTNDSYTSTTGDYAPRLAGMVNFDVPGKLRAMAELGDIPADPTAFAQLPMSYSMTWTGSFLTPRNTDEELTAFYAHPRVVTRNNVRQFVDGTLTTTPGP